jgi:hypothetical protein
MAPATFETVANRKTSTIRKPLKGTMLLGVHPTAAVITTLVATGGQIEMPVSYTSLGWLSEDGLTFSREREFSEVRGWGSGTFLRRDIRSDDHTLSFAALETKKITKELRDNVDLAAVTMSAAGEFKYDLPDRPDVRAWRGVALGADGAGATRFYVAKVYHKLTVTEMDDEAWSDGDDPLAYNVTMSAEVDSGTGTIGTEFMFGPGALAAAADMGITVAGA